MTAVKLIDGAGTRTERTALDLLEPGSLLLRPSQLPAILALSRTKIYEMLRAGVLPSIKIDRSVRVPLKALERWIEAHTRQPEEW